MKLDKKLVALCILFFIIGAVLTYFLTSSYLNLKDAVAIPDRTYFPYVHEKISNAKNFVHVVMFEMFYYVEYNDSNIAILLQDLTQAKKRGVDVKVILEGGEDFLGEDFLETQKKACLFLQNSGIEVKFESAERTTHAKLLVIDDTVIVGSMNWNYYALEKNHEASAAVKSEILTAAYENYFWNLWRSSKNANCTPAIKVEQNVTINEILTNKEIYDGKKVTVSGKISAIKQKVSKSGNEYATFTLSDAGESLRVFVFGHPEISENEKVTVTGVYRKEKTVSGYTYYNEVEAEEMKK